jgi:hypothetical protein
MISPLLPTYESLKQIFLSHAVMYTCNPSSQEAELGRSRVQGHPGLPKQEFVSKQQTERFLPHSFYSHIHIKFSFEMCKADE